VANAFVDDKYIRLIIDDETARGYVSSMGRPRKRGVQTELHLPKLDKNGQHRGGARLHAGRPTKGEHAGASHAARPAVNRRQPQHITLRVTSELGWLRRLDMYAAVRGALRTVLGRHEDFRIVHLSLQNTHLHLIVEANDQACLANGLRAFQISAARRLNAAYSRRRRIERTGRVFTDRYHAEPLGSVRQVRSALAYVINNWRRHRDDDGAFTLLGSKLDPYASGLAFHAWREGVPREPALPTGYEPPPVSAPRCWLINYGLAKTTAISMLEVPGPRKIRTVDA